MTTPGEPTAAKFERHLADLEAEDGSRWAFDAQLGAFTSEQHPDAPPCRDAASVAHFVSGDNGTVRQAREQGEH